MNKVKFTLRLIPLNEGGYDSMGAYWGAGPSLYWYSAEAEINGRYPDGFIRAKNRTSARAQVREMFPQATFYR